MIIEILFVCSALLYIVYRFIENYDKQLDYDLINSMNLIAKSLEDGDSLESAITDVSHGTDKASVFFRNIVETMKQGLSLSESFIVFEKKKNSQIVRYLSRLVTAYEKSGEDISEQLHEIAETLFKLKGLEKELYAKTITSVMVIQILGTAIAPFGIMFIAELLHTSMYPAVYFFMFCIVLMVGTLDYILYSDLAKVVCILPLFMTAYLIVITNIAPFITSIFLSVGR